MKIRTKILLIALSLILVTGAVSTIVGQFVTRNIVRKQIADKLETVAESRAHHIQTFLKTQKEAIEQLSESIVIEEFLLASEDDYDFVQKFGDVLRRLKNTAESAEYDLDVFVLDESGIIVASSDERDIGEDRSGDPYFGGAKEGAFIKDAYVSQHRKRNSLVFSAPVFDEEDPARLGVVVTRLSMEELNRIAACRTGLGKTGEIYLVNKEGYMLTPSRFVEDTFLKLKVDTENVRDCLEDLKRFGAEEHEHEAILCKNYLDTDIIGIHQHIPEVNWCLLAEVSEKEAFAPITSLTRLMLSILGVLLVVGIVVSILISGTISKPISKLHHGTDEVAGGNLDFKVGTGAKDEIGQLSRTFDSMTANLKESKARVEEYRKTLEERIKARTKQLAAANEGLRQEIEERKQVEQRLRLFSHSVESSVDGVVMGDLEGIITCANEAFARMFGYSQEELIGTEIPFLYAESQLHKLEEALQATREGGWTGDLIARRKGGGLFPVEVSSSAIVDDEGKIIAQVATHRDITERKVAEEVLRESEERYRTLLENLPQKIFYKDRRSVYVSCNENYAVDLKIKPEEIAGKTDYDFYPKELAEKYQADDRRLMESGETEDIEEKYIQHGKELFVHTVKTPVRDEGGNVVGILGVFWDITEHRQAEEALRQSEERYRTLVEAAQEGINIVSPEEEILFSNKAFASMLGYEPWELEGKNLQELVTEEQYKTFQVESQKRMKGIVSRYEIEMRHRDGSYRSALLSAAPLYDSEGNRQGALGMLVDITERKQAEKALQESEEKYRDLFENASDLIQSVAPDGRFIYVNRAWRETLGYDEEEVAGLNMFDIIHPDSQAHCMEVFQRVISGEVVDKIETVFVTKGGKKIVVEGTADCVFSEGKPDSTRGIFRDITERKKGEEVLGEVEAERRRITEALREAEKLAVVGEMAGRVAHEVLNPITALLSRTQSQLDYTNVTQEAVEAMKEIIADWQENIKKGTLSQYLLQKSAGERDATYGEEDLTILSQAVEKNADNLKRNQEFLSFFERHIMRVVEIIDNLRQMAKARREIEEVDVNSCLKEVAGLFHDGLDKRKITLLRRLVPGLPMVYVDRTELFQVFSNLLRNAVLAIDSKGEGGGEVTFTSELIGGEIWVRVIDNGVGVSEENKLLIFEHDFSTKSEKEGTGLGLAISRRLVREMGGELLLESSLSEGGSTFLVRLPLTKATKIAEIDTEKATAV
jgi:PAS domain S-box-containing protein